MIVLTKEPELLRLDVNREAVCVRHHSCGPPITGSGCLHLTHEEFTADHRRALADRNVMVVVGLSRIATPGNRTKVGPLLWGPLAGVRRISVDRTLFIVEPWRAWWHFGAVGAKYREYTYSYLAESHWRAAQEGLREDPFSLDAITKCGTGVIRSTYQRFFDRVDVEVAPLSGEVHAEYQKLKAQAFEEEHTPKAIIARLAAFAQSACPRRSIPTPARWFTRDSHRIVRTDLRVDEYLTGQLLELAKLTNDIGERFYDAR